MATIDQLPSGKHRARVYIAPGETKSRTFTKEADAIKWANAAELAKETGRPDSIGADKQTLAELAAEHFLAQRPNLAPSTYTTYREIWKANVHGQKIASRQIRLITPETIEAWMADRRAQGAGEVSLRRAVQLVQQVLNRGVKYGRISYNPAALVTKPTKKRQGTAKPISPAQVEKIRKQLTGADAVLVSVLAYAGLRPGEARALKWSDIGAKNITVSRAVSRDKIAATKTGTSRSVRLLAPLADDLAKWKTKSGKPGLDAYVFPRADGTFWTDSDFNNWRNRTFTPARKASGVPLGRVYDLRHSAASLFLHEGTSPVQVAVWMGHSVAELLNTYTHVIADLDPDVRTSADKTIAAARKPKRAKRPASATDPVTTT